MFNNRRINGHIKYDAFMRWDVMQPSDIDRCSSPNIKGNKCSHNRRPTTLNIYVKARSIWAKIVTHLEYGCWYYSHGHFLVCFCTYFLNSPSWQQLIFCSRVRGCRTDSYGPGALPEGHESRSTAHSGWGQTSAFHCPRGAEQRLCARSRADLGGIAVGKASVPL